MVDKLKNSFISIFNNVFFFLLIFLSLLAWDLFDNNLLLSFYLIFVSPWSAIERNRARSCYQHQNDEWKKKFFSPNFVNFYSKHGWYRSLISSLSKSIEKMYKKNLCAQYMCMKLNKWLSENIIQSDFFFSKAEENKNTPLNYWILNIIS